MLEDEEPPRAGAVRPRAHIVTVYGLHAREAGGWLSVSSLIRMMGQLGVDEPAVRSSISRLKRRGLLEARRERGAAGYALSERMREVLTEGDRRIFQRTRATLDDGWVLAVFSVPESERQKRHTLRARLTWLGFGIVGPGVWVAPGHLEEEVRAVLERLELAPYVDLFHADYLGFRDVRAEAASWWDLAELDRLYRQYQQTYAPLLVRWRRRRRDEPGQAFADHVAAVTAWRRLPYLDPGLAPELLPEDWAGEQAAETFRQLHERLRGPAHDYVESVR